MNNVIKHPIQPILQNRTYGECKYSFKENEIVIWLLNKSNLTTDKINELVVAGYFNVDDYHQLLQLVGSSVSDVIPLLSSRATEKINQNIDQIQSNIIKPPSKFRSSKKSYSSILKERISKSRPPPKPKLKVQPPPKPDIYK